MHEVISSLFAVFYGTMWLLEIRRRKTAEASTDLFASYLIAANVARFVIRQDGSRKFVVSIPKENVEQSLWWPPQLMVPCVKEPSAPQPQGDGI